MEREIINTYDQLVAAGGGIAITYQARGDSRMIRASGWHVYQVNARGKQVITDKDAHWSHHGCAFFGCFAQDKDEALRKAIEFAAKLGEKGPWVGNAMHDKVPERIQKAFPIRRRKRAWQKSSDELTKATPTSRSNAAESQLKNTVVGRRTPSARSARS